MLLVVPKGWFDLVLIAHTSAVEAPGLTDISLIDSESTRSMLSNQPYDQTHPFTTGIKPAQYLSDACAKTCQKRSITMTKSRHRYRGKTIKKAPL